MNIQKGGTLHLLLRLKSGGIQNWSISNEIIQLKDIQLLRIL